MSEGGRPGGDEEGVVRSEGEEEVIRFDEEMERTRPSVVEMQEPDSTDTVDDTTVTTVEERRVTVDRAEPRVDEVEGTTDAAALEKEVEGRFDEGQAEDDTLEEELEKEREGRFDEGQAEEERPL